MTNTNLTCCVCSCFCDDIKVELKDRKIVNIENACLKGSSFILKSFDQKQRSACLVNRQKVELEEAVERAADLLCKSQNPLIFGLGHCTLEAQVKCIEIAARLNGAIDDYSSFGQGKLLELIFKGALPSCSLSEIEKADLIVYWGANPQHTHPRHLSEFTYYASPRYSEISASRSINLCAVDIRETETAVAASHFCRLLPGEDPDFINMISSGVDRRLRNLNARRFIELLYNSSECVLFTGSGLVYSLNNDMAPFAEMINKLDLNLKVIPMTDQPNQRGFNQALFDRTGCINRVSFKNGIAAESKTSFLKQVKNGQTDCILILGADPFSSIPFSICQDLKKIPLITIDPFITATTAASTIVISSAVSGLESGGTGMRMDGARMNLTAVQDAASLSDQKILNHILERLN